MADEKEAEYQTPYLPKLRRKLKEQMGVDSYDITSLEKVTKIGNNAFKLVFTNRKEANLIYLMRPSEFGLLHVKRRHEVLLRAEF